MHAPEVRDLVCVIPGREDASGVGKAGTMDAEHRLKRIVQTAAIAFLLVAVAGVVAAVLLRPIVTPLIPFIGLVAVLATTAPPAWRLWEPLRRDPDSRISGGLGDRHWFWLFPMAMTPAVLAVLVGSVVGGVAPDMSSRLALTFCFVLSGASLGVAVLLGSILLLGRRLLPDSSGWCRSCGHRLAGPSEQCPECGARREESA